MSSLISSMTGDEFKTSELQTPAQSFYHQYGTAISSDGLIDRDPPQFYADNAVFHSQNGVDYSGDQIWPWIKQLFGQFEKLSHDVLKMWGIQNENGTVHLVAQTIRHIWAPGNKSDKPTVSVPMSMVCNIGSNNGPKTVGGLQFKEVWLYWDTYPLLPHFSEDSVVFSPENIRTRNE